MSFEKLNLIEPVLRALKAEGYTQPTPIQEQAIPIILQRKDLLGCAQTGTGKTAAFAIPILQLLHQDELYKKGPAGIKTLILTPTRELAIQIGESFTAYGKYLKIRHTVIFGGVSQKSQTDALRSGVDILIATPGRLLDLMNQRYVHLQHINTFVLDEADRMLDMGFIHDVKKIIAKLPSKRQTLFFSATMPAEISKLADTILTNPVRVQVTPVSSTANTVVQSVYFVEKSDKRSLLLHLLKQQSIETALDFTRTTRVLVATDIAARGIDIDDLSHVVNYELPNIPETYVHRIGRTGRAGASGIALSFCDTEEKEFLRDIHKLIARTIPVVEDHPYHSVSGTNRSFEGQRQSEPRRSGSVAPRHTQKRWTGNRGGRY